MLPNSTILSLSQAVDIYCALKEIDRPKNYKSTLILAAEVFKEIFRNTLFNSKSSYVTLKNDGNFNYVDIPADCERFFGLSVSDAYNQLKPLSYNQNLNVLVKPVAKACGCKSCDCGSLCSATGSLLPVTEIVVINGISYTNTTWIKTSPNGDIMEYRTINTPRYELFNHSSYDVSSYDSSYEISQSVQMDVIVYTLVKKVCSLGLLPCGCPVQSEDNNTLFFDACGCYINPYNSLQQPCKTYWGANNYYAGSCKMDSTGTKVIVEYVADFASNQQLMISYQTNGMNADGETMMPDYAKMCLYAGIEYYKAFFKNLHPKIIDSMYYKYIDEQNKIIVYKNPVAIEDLAAIKQMAQW